MNEATAQRRKTWRRTASLPLLKMSFPSCLPPQREHVIAIEDVELFHSGCLWKSMWAIMMEHERGEGEGEKREEKEGPSGLLGAC